MYVRYIRPEDDRMSISEIYERSWKYAYKDILPDSYLNAIPRGHWASVIDSPGWNTLILFEQEKMVGTSSFCQSRFPQFEGCGEIISLYLLPEYMGKGYGKELLKTVTMELSAQGFQKIFLWVLEENNRARHFYERYGFLKAVDVIEEKIGGKNVREIRYVQEVNLEVHNI